MVCPLDYSLCRDTLTVYRRSGTAVSRRVFTNGFLQIQDKRMENSHSPELERAFLLVLPGEADIAPGDRVLPGEGPVVDACSWGDFSPAKVPGLCQIQYVQPCYFMGRLCHTEAGRKASTFFY